MEGRGEVQRAQLRVRIVNGFRILYLRSSIFSYSRAVIPEMPDTSPRESLYIQPLAMSHVKVMSTKLY
ncbi:60s acidic ribosomal protein p0 [Moniliophthora roreri]|nr:60s acidic ribosomal protein p0 [Moniliophthora roreri]